MDQTSERIVTSTPIDIDRLEMELTEHPDRDFVFKLVNGLRNIFFTGIDIPPTVSLECPNNKSAKCEGVTGGHMIRHSGPCDSRGSGYGTPSIRNCGSRHPNQSDGLWFLLLRRVPPFQARVGPEPVCRSLFQLQPGGAV